LGLSTEAQRVQLRISNEFGGVAGRKLRILPAHKSQKNWRKNEDFYSPTVSRPDTSGWNNACNPGQAVGIPGKTRKFCRTS